MPLHLSSSSSSSSRSILPPLNIMRSLSLCRKAKPTCTLSLASVSAPPPSQGSPDENAMQVDSLQLDVHFVAVPISPPKTLRRTKTKTKTTTPTTPTTLHDINVIPFPTSAQTTNPTTQDSSSPITPNSHTNSYKRPQLQKKEGLEHPVSSSVSPPRKRARKGSLTTSSSSSSRNTPSARARALAQRVPPARPSTPTPEASDEMESQTSCDKCPVEPSSVEVEQQPAVESTQQQRQDVDKQGHTDLPPYSPSPPPYSPPVVSPTPITSSPTPIPLHVPVPVPIAPPSDPSPPTSRPLPPSPPPPPPPPPSPSPPPRRPRISPSELKFFIYLYRTLVSGLEARQRSRWDTQPIRRARDGSRREQHLDGVLVEDDDDDTDDAAASAVDKSKELTTSLYEDLEVQDALLALRLRGFLKWNGVDEWLLKTDSSSPPTSPTSPTSKTLNPFLEDDNDSNNSGSGEVTKMDVDVQEQEEQEEIPILSSQHLITVLRMRGSCGSRQGPGLGMMRKREQSKLRNCCYRAGEEDS